MIKCLFEETQSFIKASFVCIHLGTQQNQNVTLIKYFFIMTCLKCLFRQ